MDMRRIPGVAEFLNVKMGRPMPSPATWDPSVLIVFSTALGIQTILYQMLVKNRKQTIMGQPISTPTNSALDLKLVGGAALFGAGWALSGFCPGPALASAFGGNPDATVFLTTTLMGMLLYQLGVEYKFDLRTWLNNGTTTGLASSLVGMAILSAVTGIISIYFPLVGYKLPLGPIQPVLQTLAGGALIGLSGFAYTITLGKVMGLSGMLAQHFSPITTSQERLGRWAFIGGLASAAFLIRYLHPIVFFSSAPSQPVLRILLSGLLVGFGTGCSNGCTSGHGLAGISRFALRSIIATVTFFGTNVLLSTLVF